MMNWTLLPKYSEEYIKGVKDFVLNGMANFGVGTELRCPCKKCTNRFWHSRDVVYEHLICQGPYPEFVNWIYEISTAKFKKSTGISDDMDCDTGGFGLGEDFDDMVLNRHKNSIDTGVKNQMNKEAMNFYRLVEEGKQPLYPGSKTFTRLGFIVKLYMLKCTCGFTESAFSAILELIKEAFPESNLPPSFSAAKGIIKELGLDYEKIHACPNDCMLYWDKDKKENNCKVCGVSRWKSVESDKAAVLENNDRKTYKVPAKVLRYFPLKPRLQRMFLCKEYSQLMTWHSTCRTIDGKLRHPVDAKAWKSMDASHPNFSQEARNVRLGLAADGFNPYRTMSISHSTWPVMLVNYNLPPWLIMKPENIILSTLIPGPIQPGNEIYVYLQPLIAELKELWDVGIQTYDAHCNNTFTLRASLLWTISDFPGYGVLSGWTTKGYLCCPECHYETSTIYLKHSRKVCYMNHRKFLPPDHKLRFDTKRFNGEVETGLCPKPLTGKLIENLLAEFRNNFGKQKRQEERWRLSLEKKVDIF